MSDRQWLQWQPFLKACSPVLRVTIAAWSALCIESFKAIRTPFMNRLQPGAYAISIQEETMHLAVSSQDMRCGQFGLKKIIKISRHPF